MIAILISLLVMWILCRCLWPRHELIQPSQVVIYTPAITINVYVERSHE